MRDTTGTAPAATTGAGTDPASSGGEPGLVPVGAGLSGAAPDTQVRVLTPDVVVASIPLRVVGQGLLDGGPRDRDGDSPHELQRHADAAETTRSGPNQP